LNIVFFIATASELDKFRSTLIKEGLSAFRCLFESTREDLGVAVSSDAVQAVFSTAAVTGMARLLVDKFFADVHSCQKPGTRSLIHPLPIIFLYPDPTIASIKPVATCPVTANLK